MDWVAQAVYVEGGVVCQVDIGHAFAPTGDPFIYLPDGVWVEASAWEDGGDNDLGGREGLCGSFRHSCHAVSDSFLLHSELISSCVNYYDRWLA